MTTFSPSRPARLNLRNSSRHGWAIRWFIKSWLVPGIGTIAFAFMLAYALAEWCVQ